MTDYLPNAIARLNSFSLWSTQSPDTPHPGVWLDTEFGQVANFSSEVAVAFRKVLQADGRLLDAIVEVWNLSPSLRLMLGGNWLARGDWATSTLYQPHDVVRYSTQTWFCMTQHVSAVFLDDLAAGRWAPLSVSEAQSVAIAAIDGLAAGNVQEALEEIFSAVVSFIQSPTSAIPEYVQGGVYTYAGTAGGTATALTIELDPVPSTLTEGMTISFKAAANSAAGGTTVAITGLAGSPIPLKARGGNAIMNGAWKANDIVYMVYTGTEFRYFAGDTATTIGYRRSESSLIVPTAKGAGTFTHGLQTVIRHGALVEVIYGRFGWTTGDRFPAQNYVSDYGKDQWGIITWESSGTEIGYQMLVKGIIAIARAAEVALEQGSGVGVPSVVNAVQTALNFNVRIWAEGY